MKTTKLGVCETVDCLNKRDSKESPYCSKCRLEQIEIDRT